MDSISQADITYGSITMSQTKLKILQTYLYELRSMIEHDAYKCKLITTTDELTYHASIVSQLIKDIDKILCK